MYSKKQIQKQTKKHFFCIFLPSSLLWMEKNCWFSEFIEFYWITFIPAAAAVNWRWMGFQNFVDDTFEQQLSLPIHFQEKAVETFIVSHHRQEEGWKGLNMPYIIRTMQPQKSCSGAILLQCYLGDMVNPVIILKYSVSNGAWCRAQGGWCWSPGGLVHGAHLLESPQSLICLIPD